MEPSAAVALAITASFDGLLSMDRYHQELFHRLGMNSRATAVLAQDDVLRILESPLSDNKTAAVYGCTRQAIANIRTGKAFAYLYPHIKRRDLKHKHVPTCTNCSHWNDSTCSFDFPEANEDPTFAAECQLFNPR
jgi:hypothetical protein